MLAEKALCLCCCCCLFVWCSVCSPFPASVGDKVTTALNTAKADAAAIAIVNAGRRGKSSAVAAAAADSLVEEASKGKASSVAAAFAVSAARDATAFAAVLARAAAGARSRGKVDSFAKGCVSTHDFVAAGNLPSCFVHACI